MKNKYIYYGLWIGGAYFAYKFFFAGGAGSENAGGNIPYINPVTGQTQYIDPTSYAYLTGQSL